MGKRCVVANCSSTHKDGTSLFTFPRDPKMRSTWNRQIKTTRADWHNPSPYSCVCSKHFTQDCFQPLSIVSGKLGLKRKQLLKPGAVPTIFPKNTIAIGQRQSIRPRRTAYKKREHSRIISDVCGTTSPNLELQEDATTQSDICTSTSNSGLHEDVNNFENECDKVTQTETDSKNVKIQVKPRSSNKGLQVKPTYKDIAIQCNILPQQPCPDNANNEYEDCEEMESDVSDEDDMDTSYEGNSAITDETDECDSDDDNNRSWTDNPITQKKFIVFL
uniref:THAP-type domain-containing protein n=1 Tax=Amphimedon queenslandica TaxID=400682 RepID=A0A1X7VGJ9_AMPQE